jgi:hypothetical protein
MGTRARSGRPPTTWWLWPYIEDWAAELGLTALDAVALTSRRPEEISGDKEPSGEPAEPEAAGP